MVLIASNAWCRRRRLASALAVVPVVLLATAGCVTMTRPPSATYARTVLSGRGAVVLLRLESRRAALALRLASVDDAGPAKVVIPLLAPSAPAAAQGWVYLEVGVGTHFLEAAPSVHVMRAPGNPMGRIGDVHRGEFVPAPAFRFDVRPGDHAIYAGTLALDLADPGAGAAAMPIVDESAAARQVFDRDLARVGFSAFVTRLARPYDERLPAGTIGELAPVGLATSSADLERFNWRRRALEQWMTPAGVVAMGGLSTGSGPVGAAARLLALAYTPIGAVGGLISGEVAEHERAPCVAALGAELLALHPQEHLASTMREHFASRALQVPLPVEWRSTSEWPGGADPLRAVLLASITRAELRDVGRGRFHVEIAARARLGRAGDSSQARRVLRPRRPAGLSRRRRPLHRADCQESGGRDRTGGTTQRSLIQRFTRASRTFHERSLQTTVRVPSHVRRSTIGARLHPGRPGARRRDDEAGIPITARTWRRYERRGAHQRGTDAGPHDDERG
jgi:hypothetical protein